MQWFTEERFGKVFCFRRNCNIIAIKATIRNCSGSVFCVVFFLVRLQEVSLLIIKPLQQVNHSHIPMFPCMARNCLFVNTVRAFQSSRVDALLLFFQCLSISVPDQGFKRDELKRIDTCVWNTVYSFLFNSSYSPLYSLCNWLHTNISQGYLWLAVDWSTKARASGHIRQNITAEQTQAASRFVGLLVSMLPTQKRPRLLQVRHFSSFSSPVTSQNYIYQLLVGVALSC